MTSSFGRREADLKLLKTGRKPQFHFHNGKQLLLCLDFFSLIVNDIWKETFFFFIVEEDIFFWGNKRRPQVIFINDR